MFSKLLVYFVPSLALNLSCDSLNYGIRAVIIHSRDLLELANYYITRFYSILYLDTKTLML